MDKLREIIDKYTEGNYLISESDKEKMSEDILNLFDVSGIFPAMNTVRQEIDKYNETTIQGKKGHFQNGINFGLNHVAKALRIKGLKK